MTQFKLSRADSMAQTIPSLNNWPVFQGGRPKLGVQKRLSMVCRQAEEPMFPSGTPSSPSNDPFEIQTYPLDR